MTDLWIDAVAARWERERVTAPAPPVAAIDRLHDLAVRACAPFRAGTRFRSLPDVRFHVARGWLRAPGDLLPDVRDRTMLDYIDRLHHALVGEPFLLTVEQPFILDRPLWTALRRHTDPLWARVGVPELPVTAEILVGSRYRGPRPVGGGSLTWVMSGLVITEAEPEAAGEELAVHAGEIGYQPRQPSGWETFGPGTIAVRLRLNHGDAAAAALAREALSEAVERSLPISGAVTYVPYPPPVATDGSVEVVARFAAVAEAVERAVARRTLDRLIGLRWAVQRSAGALEPSPPPRLDATLRRSDRVRLTGAVVRGPTSGERSTWAVNGHAFPVAAGKGDAVLDALAGGRDATVARICESVGGRHDEPILALLIKLHQLGALDIAE